MNKALYDEIARLITYGEYAVSDKGVKKLQTDVKGMNQAIACLEDFSSRLAKSKGETKVPKINEITVEVS